MSAQTFYIAAVALLAASFVANGGWDGDRFERVRNYDAADKLLFLAGAMLAGCAAAWIGG